MLTPGAGQTLSALFTPTDGADYTTATGTTTINVTTRVLPGIERCPLHIDRHNGQAWPRSALPAASSLRGDNNSNPLAAYRRSFKFSAWRSAPATANLTSFVAIKSGLFVKTARTSAHGATRTPMGPKTRLAKVISLKSHPPQRLAARNAIAIAALVATNSQTLSWRHGSCFNDVIFPVRHIHPTIA